MQAGVAAQDRCDLAVPSADSPLPDPIAVGATDNVVARQVDGAAADTFPDSARPDPRVRVSGRMVT